MRTFIAISLLIEIVACQQSEQPKQSKQLISLVTEDLKYSAYSWYYNTRQWEFYLDYYVDIQKNGQFNLMLKDSFMSKPKYFKGIINDTISKLIDKTFSVDTFQTDYKSQTLQNSFYDGLTYCLDYRIKSNNQKKIIFVQSGSPNKINKLSTALDTLVRTPHVKQIDTLELAMYVNELKRFSSASLGPLPKLIKLKTKWEPVKISK